MKTTISAYEKRWRAESDARTLAEANRINADKKRLNSAIKAANELAKKAEQEAKNLRIVKKK